MLQRRQIAGLAASAAVALLRLRAAAAATAGVYIENFAFVPQRLVVPVGTTVRLTNHDDIPHTIVYAGGADSFRSPVLDSDESFTRMFDTAGTFAYFCSLHPHMRGEIEVQ